MLSLKSQTKNHHIIGLDIGYATWPGKVGYMGEANFNYFYAYKHLCAKVELGMAPATHFGNIKKIFLTAGFTTDLNKKFSYHITLGLGGLPGDNTYSDGTYVYDYVTSGWVLSNGIFYQPFKNNKLSFGLNISTTSYYIYPNGTFLTSVFNSLADEGFVLFTNLSFNYKINGKRTPKTEVKVAP